ncbi:uncharacterized protein ASPGLDRAFT_1376467 [Aspergillus glaucus CBS 516.65]|uniref:Uncharacterized protein n=1 Tax=Aspergillus glaucus CBS 516.65 TaxID=1160497 RepID=A0A1L9VP11_ASPGL|nr:hypothetical protein ASPGLDRAFT_1376467 [Aspergillus glaucus CBS 516.65]OJJ85639.1 hypothetical protein ASPGLDRAFT_1376467 [Aspergillus glaucus CBS 516.65]
MKRVAKRNRSQTGGLAFLIPRPCRSASWPNYQYGVKAWSSCHIACSSYEYIYAGIAKSPSCTSGNVTTPSSTPIHNTAHMAIPIHVHCASHLSLVTQKQDHFHVVLKRPLLLIPRWTQFWDMDPCLLCNHKYQPSCRSLRMLIEE